MRWGALVAFDIALLLAGVVGAGLVGLGCDENVQTAESTRRDVCTGLGELGGFRWWSLACWPAFLFSAAALATRRRDRLPGLAAAIFVALVAVDAVLIAIVTSNLFASDSSRSPF
jgi:hypothetical protein